MIVLEKHTVPEGVTNIRLINYGVKVFTGITTRAGFKKAIKRGEVLLDGKETKQGIWVQPGQFIELIDKQLKPPKVYNFKLEVVFEDESLAIINKPAGISVSGNKYYTIVNALPFNLNPSTTVDALKIPHPVHRLDFPTSGLLVVAKTKTAVINLGRQFENRTVKKQYAAVVVGDVPEHGIIDTPLEGQEAVTEFNRIQQVPSLKVSSVSFVHLFPLTGRTHQLRKHMALGGTPIVGDSKYTKDIPLLKGKGLFLCAIGISFLHPITQKAMHFQIETPAKFATLMKREELVWKKYSH